MAPASRLVLFGIFLCPVFLWADGKADPKEPREPLKPTTRFVGKLTKIGKDKVLTVELRQTIVVTKRSSTGKVSYKKYEQKEKFEVQPAPDMKVRTLQVPVIDDNGKPRRPTAREKKVLKGPDPKLPGYTADFAALKTKQIVEIHLGTVEVAPAPIKEPASNKTAPGDKKAEEAKIKTVEVKPQVTMIVIVQ